MRLSELKKLAVEPKIVPENEAPSGSSASRVKLERDPGLGLSLSEDTESEVPKDPGVDNASSGELVELGEDLPRPRSDDGKETATPAEPPLPVLEQLFILLKFIEEHFKDTVDELARLKADGYMTFKLLWTLCAPGSTVETKDKVTEYPIGVSVTSWTYGTE